jgi:tetratricopeptide (TPR) repeat protein
MTQNPPGGATKHPSLWVPMLGGACGAGTLLFLMWLSVRSSPIPCESRFLVVAVLALGAALASAFIGGSVAAVGRLPLPFTVRHPIRVSAAGGAAVLLAVALFGYWMYASPEKCKENIDNHLAAMAANFERGDYADALSKADDVLRLDPVNARAWNVRASVHFFRREYSAARDDFERAWKSPTPGINRGIIAKNLADAYVETGAYEKAFDYYAKADPSDEVTYGVGRAHVFNQQYDDALKDLRALPSSLLRGSARIVSAAAFVGKAAAARNAEKQALLENAKHELHLGCSQDSAYWTAVLSGNKQDIHESHDLLIKILGPIFDKRKPCGATCA